MSCFIKNINKKIAVTYLFESTSYWDSEKKQPRAHRVCIGKLNCITGEILPTGRPGRPRKTTSELPKKSEEDRIKALEAEVRQLKYQLKCMSAPISTLEQAIADLRSAYDRCDLEF